MNESADELRLTAKAIYGLEEVLSFELKKLGARDIELHNRAVSFTGDKGLIYKCNLHLRTALRILVPIEKFNVQDEQSLYDGIKAIDWEQYMGVDDTLGIDCVLNTPLFTHSLFIAQKAKDAIADQFRDRYNKRPSVDLAKPVLRIHLHVYNDVCTVALDSSGESLHKRGYRSQVNLAPMNEVLAAGLVLLSGWNRSSNLIDPMCGSGTILIEAALIAANIPPGYYKEDFGFMRWTRYLAYDADNVARKAKENVKFARVEDMVHIRECAMEDFEAPEGGGVVIMNPPYGERMDMQDSNELYASMGDTFKKRFTGYDCWIISSNMEALKYVGLKSSRRIPVANGHLECRFVKYEMYSGTKRVFKEKSVED